MLIVFLELQLSFVSGIKMERDATAGLLVEDRLRLWAVLYILRDSINLSQYRG